MDGGTIIIPESRVLSSILEPGPRLSVCPNPFSSERIDGYAIEGMSIKDIVSLYTYDQAMIPFAHVWVANQDLTCQDYVDRSRWAAIRPKSNCLVTIRFIPQGGGGGGGKSPLRLIATIAIMALAAYGGFVLGPMLASAVGFTGASAVAGGLGATMMGAVVSGAITMIGSMLVNALIPPAKSNLSDLSTGATTSPTLSLTGTQNKANQYGVVPYVFGRHKISPMYAAAAIDEWEGQTQYLRLMFDFGYGPLDLSDISIGSTTLDEFDGIETDIRYGYPDDYKQYDQIDSSIQDRPINLYTNIVAEDGYSAKCSSSSEVSKTTSSRIACNEATFDLTFPALCGFDGNGNPTSRSVQFQIMARKSGQTSPIFLLGQPVTASDIYITDVSSPPAVAKLDTANAIGFLRSSSTSFKNRNFSEKISNNSITIAGFQGDNNIYANGQFTILAMDTNWIMLGKAFGGPTTVMGIAAGSPITISGPATTYTADDINKSTIVGLISDILFINSSGFNGISATNTTFPNIKVGDTLYISGSGDQKAASDSYYGIAYRKNNGLFTVSSINKVEISVSGSDVAVIKDTTGGKIGKITSTTTKLSGMSVSAGDIITVRSQISSTDEDGNPSTISSDLKYQVGSVSNYEIDLVSSSISGTQSSVTAQSMGTVGLKIVKPGTYNQIGLKETVAPGYDGNPPSTAPTTISIFPIGAKTIPTITAATSSTYVWTGRFIFPEPGQYDIIVKRITPDNKSSTIRDDAVLSMIRSIKYADNGSSTSGSLPRLTGHCIMAMRIKATNQLNGVVQTLNAIAQSKLRYYNANTASWVYPYIQDSNGICTKNTAYVNHSSPSWAMVEILTGVSNKRPIDISKIDIPAFLAYDSFCKTMGYEYNTVIDYQTTVRQAIFDIGTVTRAMPVQKGDKYSVVYDAARVAPVQLFTPRNSFGFKYTKLFYVAPHALRVRFVNPDKGWQQDEVIVYNCINGTTYDVSNATLFETLEVAGCIDSNHAISMGIYTLACAALRPNSYTLSCDIEHFVANRGDWVKAQHDVLGWGIGSGRIKSVAIDSGTGNVVSFISDETFSLAAGTYAIRARQSNGTLVLLYLSAVSGNLLTLQTPTAPSACPAVGDLFSLGTVGNETVDLVVKSIARGDDMTAVITLVDYAPDIFTTVSGSKFVGTYDSNSVWQNQGANYLPPHPNATLTSDETAMVKIGGDYVAAVRFDLDMKSVPSTSYEYLEIQYRTTGSGGSWLCQSFLGRPTTVSVTNIVEQTTYDFRARWIGGGSNTPGLAGPWTNWDSYTVLGRYANKPAPPVDATRQGSTLIWYYPNPPNDFSNFIVRYNNGNNDNWANAILLSDLVTGTSIDISALIDGYARTLMVKAVDTAGNESDTATTIYVGLGTAPVPINIIDQVDVAAAGFVGGTIINGTAVLNGGVPSGHALIANDYGTLYLPVDNDAYLPSGSANYLGSTYKHLKYIYEYVVPSSAVAHLDSIVINITAVGTWSLTYAVGTWDAGSGKYLYGDIGLFDQLVAPFTDDSEVFLADDAADFLPDRIATEWPYLINLPIPASYGQSVRVTFSGLGGTAASEVFALKFTTSGALQTENLHDISIGSSGGTSIPTTKTWRVIKSVQLSVKGGGSANTALVIDKSTSGPHVQTYNSSGTSVSGVVDAYLEGY